MDPMFAIPETRKKLSALKLCLIMGITALLFILVADRFGGAIEATLQASYP